MIDIDKLEALAKAANQGDWSVAPRVATYKVCDIDPKRQALLEQHAMDRFEAVSVGTSCGQIANVPLDESSRENAAYIAAAKPTTILELIAEVRRLREDAERYRWIRSVSLVEYMAAFKTISGLLPCGEKLDSIIDAARAKEKA